MDLLYLYAERSDFDEAQGTAELFSNSDVKWGAEALVIHGSAAVLTLY